MLRSRTAGLSSAHWARRLFIKYSSSCLLFDFWIDPLACIPNLHSSLACCLPDAIDSIISRSNSRVCLQSPAAPASVYRGNISAECTSDVRAPRWTHLRLRAGCGDLLPPLRRRLRRPLPPKTAAAKRATRTLQTSRQRGRRCLAPTRQNQHRLLRKLLQRRVHSRWAMELSI